MIRKNLPFLVLVALFCGWSSSAVNAYEVETHKVLSEEATKQSRFSEYLPLIGLKSLQDQLTYISTTKSIVEWIRTGADDEDDTISANFARYRNHFYDPQHGGAGYSYPLAPSGEPSPDWALEDTHTFITQSYSFKKARQYFYDALTLPNKDTREQWMARTFYTLGHVIHHIQDMAQPQHTRNDSHGGFFLGPKSRYELYVDDNRGELFFSDANYNQTNPVIFDKARKFWDGGDGRGMAEFSSLNFVSAGTNFSIDPNSNTPRYPSPRQADAIPHEENANDLLTNANIQVPAQCLPPNPSCVMTFYSTQVNDNYRPAASGINTRTSTSSIFDQDLTVKNAPPTYSLNRFNFYAAHQFLIPRAVAYSAGLINYFFRGRIEAQDPGYTDTGITLRIKNGIDTTQNPQYTNEILKTGGQLVVAYDYLPAGNADPSARVFGASTPVTLTEDIKPGQSSPGLYSFTLPEIPDTATDVHYRLVYRGKLGNEDDAVAASVFEPMSGFVVNPSYTPTDGISGQRLIYRAWGNWHFSKKTNIQAGNIDWKGWYGYDPNDTTRPTKVLSWIGPRARYFPDQRDTRTYSFWGREIYEGGRLLSRVPIPGQVLGAAVVRDTKGYDWLVAICMESSNGGFSLDDVVYRRPYKASDSDERYDPVNAPDGWQEIRRFGSTSFDQGGSRVTWGADIPWFFDGNGRHAQTMRRWEDTSNPQFGPIERSMRLEITISSDVTSADIKDHTGDDPAGYIASGSCVTNYSTIPFDYMAGTASASTRVQGAYVSAVDYKNDQPVLGIVTVDRSAQGSSQFSMTTVAGNFGIPYRLRNGSTQEQFRTSESFSWGASGVTLSQSESTINKSEENKLGVVQSCNANGDCFPVNVGWRIINKTTNGTGHGVDIKYLDLRYALLSSVETDDKSQSSVQKDYFSDQLTQGSQDNSTQRYRTVSSLGPDIIPFEQSSSSQGLADTDFLRGDYPAHMSCYDFPESGYPERTTYTNRLTRVLGDPYSGWGVDANNNLLISERIFSVADSQWKVPYNAVSGTRLEDLIPGANSAATFFAVGVVR